MAQEDLLVTESEMEPIPESGVFSVDRASVGEERPRRRRSPAAPPVAAKRKPRAPAESKPAKPNDDQPSQLIAKYTGLVRQIAGGFQRKLPRNVLRDDLIAAGMSGLWDAVRKHGHEQTENFDWYVRVRIRGAILDELRAQDWLPRRARAAAAEAAQIGRA